jgi:hypothetical protein
MLTPRSFDSCPTIIKETDHSVSYVMVHILFIPAFAVHDCITYYSDFISGVNDTHTIQFMSVDGYTQGGRSSIGDISLEQVVEECVQTCNREERSYALVGHSTGAKVVGLMYPRLVRKPVHVFLFNPVLRHQRLWLCRYIPLFVPLMRLLDVLPIPIITRVYTGKQFGTVSDLVPAMKYRLWIDLVSSASDAVMVKGLSQTLTTMFVSLHDELGAGGERIHCNHITTKIPGHASFRSLETMAVVLQILSKCDSSGSSFDSLYTL